MSRDRREMRVILISSFLDRHKCPGGFNCSGGGKCRFANISGAHPFPGEFHNRKNYYDSSKAEQDERESVDANGWFSETKVESEDQKTSFW